jgi:type IV pilus assembly protein PilQ
LKVKPQITPDDNIIMDISVNKDSVGQLYSGVPSIDTNQVKTQVLVENGGTVVIGGVYSQVLTDGENKVPLLGDIPVLGYLFKSTAKIDDKNELLIFISPKIMKDTMTLR